MKRHASMNRIYRLVWSRVHEAWVAVAETARGRGKGSSRKLVAAALSLAAAVAQAAPTGGQLVSGAGSISQSGATTTITQSSQNLSLNWRSFNIAPAETVNFQQPNASAIAVNRIFDTSGTQILGHLNANGQVWLINPNGILFGQGAQVNVGGLVASTLDFNDSTLNGNARSFSGKGTGSVVNQGTINAADGGYVALLGNSVSNQGVISARLGTVALGAGSAATLSFDGNSLVKMQVDQSVLNSVAENGGLIRADGGMVVMNAGAKNALLASVVNNTGVIEARTVENREGVITLLGGMQAGRVNVGGTLDASAPNGGNGGFIETSAARVKVANDARVTTAASMGLYGTWLIDPQDYTVAASGGDISGAALSTQLGTTNVELQSSGGGTPGSGNVNVNDAVSWSANQTLTLTASNNVNVNANVTATGNTAGLVINPNTANGGESASGTGTFNLGSGASVTLSGTNPSLSIAGTAYTVINSLGAAGSTSGTDLQGMNGDLAGKYALGSNIDASATSAWNSGAGFAPIEGSFSGTFDGLGHTISNLTINRPATDLVGLFGYTAAGSAIRNVGLVGGSVTGSYDVGALVGRNDGTVSNSYATGSVSGSNFVGGLVGSNYYGTVSNSYATASVGGSISVGGLVGENIFGTVNNSYATASVTGSSYVGGLVGWNEGTVSNSYATGSVTGSSYVGGLVGWSHGTVSDSYATGSVTGSSYVGGLVGENRGTVSNSYATGSVSVSSYAGGLVGYNFGTVSNSYWNSSVNSTGIAAGSMAGATGLTAAQMHTASNFTGFTFTTTPGASGWVIVDGDGTLNNAGGAAGATFPMLASEYSTTINNAHQLQLMQMAPNASYALSANVAALATGSSTDIWDSSGFVPIGNSTTPFTGTFDGLGHTISNLTINRPTTNFVGLFGLTSSSTIRNVGLVGGSVTGNNYVGGLVGYGNNSGRVSNSYTTGTVTGGGLEVGGLMGASWGEVSNCYAEGTVTGSSAVGGLVGYVVSGTVSNSYATGHVTGSSDQIGGLVGYSYGTVSNSYATGSVSGNNKVGGLVGYNASYGSNIGTVSNSYATGSVTGSSYVGGLVGWNYGTLSNSYATGSVSGGMPAGGLMGENDGTVSNSHWNKSVNSLGIDLNAGTITATTGLTTDEMRQQSNFSSWDFANTWIVYNGFTNPLLRSFMTPLTVSDAVKTYDGLTAGNSAFGLPASNIFGTLSYGGTASGAVNAGSYTVTGLSGLYSNQQGYIISYADGSLTVNKAVLTASVSAPNKVYDGNTTAAPTLTITGGLVSGETVSATGTASFNTKDVATANLVTVNTTALADGAGGLASNYSLAAGETVTAHITAKALTASVAAPDKVYDGNATAAPTLSITGGLVAGETVSAAGTASFNTKDVATANLVTVNTTALADGAGGLASNYSLASGQTVTAHITAKALTASVAAPDKVYDGNATAAPTLSITGGLVSGETVSATGTASFNTKDVATADLVTVNTTALADGAGGLASNYSLAAGETVTAHITAKALTASVAAPDKVYDGNATAAPTLSITGGLVGGETVSATGTASFNTKDVATANLVTVNTTALADGAGGLASNYSLAAGETVTAHITAKALTQSGLSVAASKVYDGSTTATVIGGAALLPSEAVGTGSTADGKAYTGDTVNITGTATGTYNSKNVASADTVTFGSLSLTGAQAGNYTLTPLTQAATITAKALTASVAAPDKVYDGNATAAPTLSITGGLVAGETVSAAGTASFNTKDVATANLVTVNTTALADGAGGLASNYSLAAGETVTAHITAKALTASVAAPDKVYDGNATAAPTLSITGGLVAGETVSAAGTASFNTKDVATANLVTVDTTALADGAGGLASNYSLASGQTVTAHITAKALTASVAAPDKVYDGNATAAPTLSITGGLVAGETVSAAGTASFNTKDVATANLVTVDTTALADGAGGLASNYSLAAGETVTAHITAKALTASVAAPDKVYDGNATAAPTLSITGGLVAGETVSAAGTASFNTKDVATANLVTVNTTALADGAGGLASNYSLASGQTVTAHITAKALTASVAAPDKVYDGNATAAPTLSITGGLVSGETVSAAGTASFNTKDVATANLVTVDTTALADGAGGLASNYSLAAGETVTAHITAKALTASVAAPDKVYDGNATAAPTLSITGGLVAGETVSAAGTASFNTKDVATANLVTVDTTALADGAGGLASNYSLAAGETVTAHITAKALTASVAAPDKVYDGNATAAPTLSITGGLVSGETVSATGTASFNTKDVATADLVTVNTTALADGAGGLASNYSLAAGETVTAHITAKALTASVAAPDKVYDGNATAAPTLSITGGLVGGETVSATGTASFNTKDVATANLVTVDTTALADGAGGLASNYSLAAGETVTAHITAKALTQSGLSVAASKVYDGSTTATVIGGAALLPSEAVGTGSTADGKAYTGDTVNITGTATGTYNSKNVASADTVTFGSLSLTGAQAGNYTLTPLTQAATITAKALTASVAAPDKVYDGNATAAPTLSITGGLVAGETVSAAGTASFNTKDVATANLVTVNTTALADGAGGLASNYSLAAGETVTAHITAKALTASVAAPDKVYDGNATAAPTLSITGGLVSGETVSAAGTASFNTKDVATADLVTVNTTALADGAGGLASNYSLAAGETVTAHITAKALTASVAAPDKVYDGNATAAPTLSITGGLVAGETVSATGTASFNTKDVATANLVTVNTTALADGAGGLASNYSLAAGETVTAHITAKALTASVAAPDKVYDGNATAAPTLSITGGLVAGETVSATGTASFNTKDVATANLVTVNTTALADGAGGLASNYSLAAGETVTAHITAKALTASVAAPDKVYDGNATAAPTLSITGGLVSGETVSAAGTASFNTKDVATANLVTVDTTALADGAGGLASNYSLAAGETVTAHITAKALTASVAAPDKVYDGNATAAPTLSITGGLVSGETVSAAGTASFNTKDVATANLVTVNTTALADGAGGLASNYSLAAGETVTAHITAKALTASVAAPDKVYDGNATAAPTLSITGGLVSGETVSATGTASFNTKDVATANLVTVNTTALADGAGGLASNYSLAAGETVTAHITAKALTASVAAPDKVYDGNATAAPTLSITGGLVAGETVSAAGTASFNTKDVATANLVTVNTTALADGAGGLASNYSLAAGETVTAHITAKALTASVAAPDKVYDGNATAAPTLSITGGLVAGETVSAAGTASFNTKDVATANLVTVNTTALADGAGGLASNYSLAAGETVTAHITAANLAVTGVTASNKVYDATTAATLGGTATITALGADVVNLGGSGTGVFADKNVGTGKAVAVSGFTLSGADAGNYSIVQPAGVTANITPKALTASLAAPNKVYDGNTTATPTLSITGGLVGIETVNASGTASFNTKDVATANLVTVNSTALSDGSNGGLAGNYSLATGQTVAANITAKALTASVAAPNKVYDGNTTATPTLSITGGLVGTETVSASGTASFNTKDVATANLVTVNSTALTNGSNGGLAGNYSLAAGQTVAANITAASLAVTGVTASNKVYDATTAATLGGTAAVSALSSDVVAVGGTGSGVFADKNVGTGKAVSVSGFTLSGADAGNYSVVQPTGVTANITAANLAVTGVTASNKVYDATTAATLGGTATIAAIGADVVNLGGSGTGVFADKNVGTGKAVTVSGYTLGGADAGNYSVVQPTGVTANITAANLAVTGVTASNKVYDATTATTLGGTATITTLGADVVNLGGTGSGVFADKNVGTGKAVTVSGFTLSGADAGNYSVVQPTGVTADITAKALTASVAAPDKVYDGNTTAAPTLSITGGLVGIETVSASGTASFNTKDVATANLVTVNSTALTDGSNGGLAGNYSLATGQTVAANITAKALTASVAAPNKVYDGNSTAAPTLSITGGLVGIETVSASGTASFNTKDVATANLVTVNSTALTDGSNGGLAGNYSLATGQTVAANITAKALTASVAAPNKVYDGNTTAAPTLSITGGLVGTETVNASGMASFNTKDVATANLVTVNSTALADGSNGGLAGNYSLATGQTVAANITAKALTASVAAPNKVYDGNTTAAPTLSITGGLVGTETVNASGTASFNTKDVATANLVTVNSTALTDGSNGGLAGNYSLATGQTVAANITAASLAVTGVTASNKVYDAATAATLAGTATVSPVGTDVVSVGGTGSGVFADKNVGTGKAVSVSGFTLLGTDAGNYVAVQPAGLTASITPATLYYLATPASFIVGQTPSGLSGTVIGYAPGDNVADSTSGSMVWTTIAGESSPPGQYPIDGGGLVSSNYVLEQATANATALTLNLGTNAIGITAVLQPILGTPNGAGNIASGGMVPRVQIVNGGVRLPDGFSDAD